MAHKFTSLFLSIGLVLMPAAALATAPPECRPADLVGLPKGMDSFQWGVGYDQKNIDRAFKKLVASRDHIRGHVDGVINDSGIDYPFDSLDHYGFTLKFVVGVKGRVTCMALAPFHEGDPQPFWTPQRWQWAGYISQWRFMPYRPDSKALSAIGHLEVREYELPKAHVPMPVGDPNDVVFIHDMPVFGYRLELHGDGRAVYTDTRDDDYLGPQAYHVDPKQVAYILNRAKEVDFWSLRDVYPRHPKNPDRYDSRIEITLGGITKSLTDYGDGDSGLPSDGHFLAYGIRHDVDFPPWPGASLAGIELLKAKGFDFQSEKGGRLLFQIMRARSVNDDVALAVMALGAPQDFSGSLYYRSEETVTMLEAALSAGRAQIANQLIANGALNSNGQINQVKIDRAFLAAVSSGEAAALDVILPYHPAMTYPDPENHTVQISVLFELVRQDFFNGAPTSALQRLLDLGADINARAADGKTILHWRANREMSPGDEDAEDKEGVVPFLLAHGANLNALDNEGKPPLAMGSEAMALLLLKHGASPRIGKAPEILRENARNGSWPRVKAWLWAHGYADVLIASKPVAHNP